MTLRPLAAEALALRADGRTAREIAVVLGVSRSYAGELYNDPTREKARARRRRYAGSCAACGVATDGSNGSACAPRFCTHCRPGLDVADGGERVWMRERIVDAIRDYAERYGRPPGARDWNPPHARAEFRDDLAERFHDDGCWPYANSVQRAFGSWNAAIAAAGFAPLASGHKYVDLGAA